jgi:L,D-peptidoglycan transpeptidase YkuD (ErfK/YbiS/YcfS/YnhG family)
MRASLAALTAVLTGVAATVLAVLAPPQARPAAADVAVAAASQPNQVITVQASSSSSTTARFDLWTRLSTGGFRHHSGPVTANLGRNGIGATREGMARTPAGVFTLTEAFGNQPTNGTRLPYFQATRMDWWNSVSSSPAYNTHMRQTYSPGWPSENLYTMGAVYAHAVVIDYNRFPVRAGAGSAFFLHVTNGRPTAGCVAIAAASLNYVMRWLNPAAHPVISMGVGSQATNIITQANAAAAKHNPQGHLDSVTGGRGTVRAVGWAADPDSPSGRVTIDLYIDGRLAGRYGTGRYRPDVAAARPFGTWQGFDFTLTGVINGWHRVCVYAHNISLGTGNPRLGCRDIPVNPA